MAAEIRLTSGIVAVVTGASRGIGRTMALALGAAGARVVPIARPGSEAALVDVARDANPGTGGGAATFDTVDIRDPDACAAVVARIAERFGRIDVLVNNAGLGMNIVGPNISSRLSSLDVAPAVWRDIVSTNVDGAFHMVRAAMPWLAAAGSGRIINVTTSRATMVRPGFAPYGPSKAALEALTAIWAEEFRTVGVDVNALLPGGATDTDMIRVDDLPDRAKLLRPEIMGPPAVWLASPQAAGITGKRIIARDWDTTDGAEKPWLAAMSDL